MVFFVTDKIKKGEVKIMHCPTQDMIGDFFTKPLQGTQFVRLRSKILNLPSSSSTAAHRSVLENDKNKGGSEKETKTKNKTKEKSNRHWRRRWELETMRQSPGLAHNF